MMETHNDTTVNRVAQNDDQKEKNNDTQNGNFFFWLRAQTLKLGGPGSNPALPIVSM